MNSLTTLVPRLHLRRILCLLALLASAGVLGAELGAEPTVRDEARWQREDTTPSARYQTLKKETDAAYRENRDQCLILPATERPACLKDAKKLHQSELEQAKSLQSK